MVSRNFYTSRRVFGIQTAMGRNIHIRLLGGLLVLCSLGAALLSVASALVIAGTGIGLFCMWAGLNRLPGDGRSEEHQQPPAGPPPRRSTQPNVLNVRPSTPRPRQLSFSERQWAALTNVLRTPSRSNLPKMPDAGKGNPAAAAPAKPLTDAEHREKLLQRQDELGTLMQRSRRKLGEQERWVQENVGQVSPEGLQALSDAKRIIDALQKRFDKTHDFLENQPFQADMAQELLELPLTIDESTVHHVSTAKSVRPLLPGEWDSTLLILLKQVSRKKSLGGGSTPGFPSTGK